MTNLIETANTALVVCIFYVAALTVNVFVDTYLSIRAERKNS